MGKVNFAIVVAPVVNIMSEIEGELPELRLYKGREIILIEKNDIEAFMRASHKFTTTWRHPFHLFNVGKKCSEKSAKKGYFLMLIFMICSLSNNYWIRKHLMKKSDKSSVSTVNRSHSLADDQISVQNYLANKIIDP